MPEPIKIDSKDFVPARAVTKIDPKDFVPANKAEAEADPPPGGSIMAPPESVGHKLKRVGKTIGQSTATLAAGTAPIAAGAYMGGEIGALGGPLAPATIPVGAVIGGGIGALAAPAAQYLAGRGVGENPPRPTGQDALRAAKTQVVLDLGIPALGVIAEPLAETVLGIRGAGGLIREGQAKAEQATENLAERQAQAEAKIAGRRQAASDKAAALAQKQEQIRGESAGERKAAAQKAVQEHQQTIAESQKQADSARAKLRENKKADLERKRGDVVEQVANRQTQQMVGKTPQQFQQEAAQSYEQRASALSRAADPFFDASAKFHEEVGEKFEPYIGEIKNAAVAPATAENLNGSLARVDSTLQERGQRIESAELRKIADEIRGGAEGKHTAQHAALKRMFPDMSDADLDAMKPERKLEYIKQATAQGILASGEAGEGLTYGQLWGLRARANRVLASAKNPADRWAAREIVGDINDAIPGVPQDIRNQYAFERKMSRSVVGKVASARTPQEVGDAIFGSKASPQPAEVPLQIIRFTKQYAPEQVDGLREAFADHYLGNHMDANDLAKLNPAVLKELYGDNAFSVVRLLTPEGELKQAGWAELIKTDPAAKDALEAAIRESTTKQANISLREAIQEGEQAVAALPPKYDYVKKALSEAKTPEAKAKILAEQLPKPEDVEPTHAEAKILAQEPPDVGKAGLRALQKGAPRLAGRMENYMQRRLMFMGLLAAGGGMSYLTRRPEYLTASLILGAGLGVRGMARYALTTEGGASAYMRVLSMKPTPENAAAFGHAVAPLIASAILQESRGVSDSAQ